ncbi:MAG TPA: amidohydrolase family protein, partial [Ignavibacteriaceae bacterium]|nr:amidohydrolase family protein [Ignavibacteriaceae bacterium]
PGIPSRESVLKARENVIKKHPNTIFIGAHMGQNVDDLKYIAYLLDTYPNYYVEPSSTLSDLGKQPYTSRKFFIKYQDRILFGTDGGSLFGVKGWTVEKFYQAYFEFFETENEFISYPLQGAINQGDWKICGINLPDSVLEKIYYKNAEKILSKKK